MQRKKLRFGKGFRIGPGNWRSQAAEMVLPPGESEGGRRNRHPGADQWLYIVAGSGLAIINDRRYTLTPGTLMLIEQGDRHEVRNTGEELLRTLNIYAPPAYRKDGKPLPRGKSKPSYD